MAAVKEKLVLSWQGSLPAAGALQVSVFSCERAGPKSAGHRYVAAGKGWYRLQKMGLHQLTTCSATCIATALWPCKSKRSVD